MSLLFREKPEVRSVQLPPGVMANLYAEFAQSMRGSSGVYVDNNSAMQHPTFWSCVTKISQDVSMMPVDAIRYVSGARQEVNPVPQILAAPSVMVTDPMNWRYQVIYSWLTAGDAWGLVTQRSADRRYPTRIELKNASSVRAVMLGNDLTFYVDNVEQQLWPVGDLWHEPAYTVPGHLLGLSPIEYHKATIGKGLAAQKYGLQYFTDGANAKGIWKLPGTPTEAQLTGFKERLRQVVRGNRDDLIVAADASYEKIQDSPDSSQYLKTEEWSGVQICSIFGEDPVDHGLSTGGSVTYANRTDADLARLKRRQFWITKLQNVLTGFLPRPQVVKLNTSASLMMTDTERHTLHKLRLDSWTTSVNEVRKIEDEPPFPDPRFDNPGIPVADSVAKQIREITPGVGVVITSDEARTILNDSGLELPVPGPDGLGPAAPAAMGAIDLQGGDTNA